MSNDTKIIDDGDIMLRKSMIRIILLIAGFVIVSALAVMTALGWNVKTARFVNGVSITPAFGKCKLVLSASEDYLFVIPTGEEKSVENMRALTSADAVNNGDTVYVRLILKNKSNINMFCRFKVDGEETNVDATYEFYFEDLTEDNFVKNDDWYYYKNIIKTGTENNEYIIWLEINVIQKQDSEIIIGTPYVDMIQALEEAVNNEEGWKETAGKLNFNQ